MKRALSLLAAVALALGGSAVAQAPRIGVYYFPGWDGSAEGSWKPIAGYPDRKPALGWYADGDPAVMRRQLGWMADAGVDYVAFDWYWENGAVHADDALRAYLAVPQEKVSFALMWADDKPTLSPDEWRRIVAFWIDRYFRSPKALKVDGRPVVFVFSYPNLIKTAGDAKSTPGAYIRTAQRMAREAGLPGIYFVANLDDLSTSMVNANAVDDGFSAVSAYNIHRQPWRPQRPGWFKLTHGYAALDDAYRQNWKEALRSDLPVVLPMTSGWDRRPWGGSADPLHDRSIATPAQFRAHLAAAKAVMAKPGKQQSGLGVICCWNEFGEGSFIEPTAARGSAILDQVETVFGGRAPRRTEKR